MAGSDANSSWRKVAEIEKRLVDIWRQVVEKDDIEIGKDIFDIGADSFTITLLMGEVEGGFDLDLGNT